MGRGVKVLFSTSTLYMCTMHTLNRSIYETQEYVVSSAIIYLTLYFLLFTVTSTLPSNYIEYAAYLQLDVVQLYYKLIV